MDYNKVQNSQPAPQQPRSTEMPRYSAPLDSQKPPKQSTTGKRLALLVSVILVVLALLIGGLYVASRGKTSTSSSATGTGVEEAGYQAVFMTNGQVYFGHFSNIDGVYAELTDVYYLQVQQPVQPADTKAKTADQSQVSLTKLGNELHGPKDRMHISRDQILFWENLKDDSTVVKAINQYKTKQQ